jgi:hypothetical protein
MACGPGSVPQVLATPSQGQARIVSVPVNTLNNLSTTIPGFDFSQAVFNLDATANGSATINAFDQFGTPITFLLPLSGNGQNFFTLTTANGELISRVQFTTTVGLNDVSQIRFGSLSAVPGPIVGAGLPGMIAACAGLIGLAHRFVRRGVHQHADTADALALLRAGRERPCYRRTAES